MAGNPKLTVLFEKLRGKVFELDKDTVSVGRKSTMDICINDATMSGHHCDFIRTPSGAYVLRDNGSTNGTRINNINITEQELKNSDIIQLGGVELLYDAPDAMQSSSISRTHTIDLNSAELNLSTAKDLQNFNPFVARERSKAARAKKTMMFVYAGIGVVLLGLLITVIVTIIRNLS